MKTKNVIIGVLSVAVVALSILLFRSTSENSASSAKELQFSPEEKDFICAAKLDTNDGEGISLNAAIADIQALCRKDSVDSVRAFHIGINTLEQLLQKAKTYNVSSGGQSDPIVGFRFYRSISTREVTGSSGSLRIRDKLDLAIFPTLGDGENLQVKYPNVQFPIYSHTRPCPKLCKKNNKLPCFE